LAAPFAPPDLAREEARAFELARGFRARVGAAFFFSALG